MTTSGTTTTGEEKKRLNVGCGRNIIDGWLNLDWSELPGINIRFDLEKCRTEQIPLPDNSVDEFLLSHVIEHIKDALAVMQELYRVAKPGATCTVRVPYGTSDDAWEDPTHVRPYFVGSFGYFSQPFYWRADYGYRGDWNTESVVLNLPKAKFQGMPVEKLIPIVEQSRNVVVEMVANMVAIKPARVPDRALQVPPKIMFALV